MRRELTVEDHISLRDTPFGAAWVFDCPLCGERLHFIFKKPALTFGEQHIDWCETRTRVP